MPLGIAAGPDGNVWFTDSGTTKAIGVINPTTHAISEFSAGLNPGSNLQQGLVAGADGNLWFTDAGTTKAIGMINPTTHAISEFSAGLNPGSSRVPRSSSAPTAPSGSWTAARRRRSVGSTRPRTRSASSAAA